jgi:hypothetical protein
MLPESRQFIALHLEPDQVTAVGPLPWTPPSPTPSDHWCLYVRVLSVQEAPLVEGANVDTNVANSNSIAWRNLKIVNQGEERKMAKFIVRNIQAGEERLTLHVEVTPALFQTSKLLVRLDERLQRGIAAGQARLEGLKMASPGVFAVTAPRASITGIRLAARQQGAATVQLDAPPGKAAEGDVQVTQSSSKGVDGGVTLRVARKK